MRRELEWQSTSLLRRPVRVQVPGGAPRTSQPACNLTVILLRFPRLTARSKELLLRLRSVRLSVRTLPFQGGERGSTPLRSTKFILRWISGEILGPSNRRDGFDSRTQCQNKTALVYGYYVWLSTRRNGFESRTRCQLNGGVSVVAANCAVNAEARVRFPTSPQTMVPVV